MHTHPKAALNEEGAFEEALESYVLWCTAIVGVITVAYSLSQGLSLSRESSWLPIWFTWVIFLTIAFVWHLIKSRGKKGQWISKQQEHPWPTLSVDLVLTGVTVLLHGGRDSGLLFLFCWCFFFASIILVPMYPGRVFKGYRVALYPVLAVIAIFAATFPREAYGFIPLTHDLPSGANSSAINRTMWIIWAQYVCIVVFVAFFIFAYLRLRYICRSYVKSIDRP